MIIAVTGTPGTGKTTLAKELSSQLKLTYVDGNEIIKENRLSEGYDQERQCEIVDARKFSRAVESIIKKSNGSVVDSHLSHYVPPGRVDACIVTVCDLKELAKRLKERGYPEQKIRDNLTAESFEHLKTEAEEMGHKVIAVDTTKGYDIKEVIRKLP